MPHDYNLTYWGVVMNEQESVVYSAYVGIVQDPDAMSGQLDPLEKFRQ